MVSMFWHLLLVFSTATLVTGKWNTTKFLFTFGDSYTTDGFNISAGVESPVPGFVSDYQQFL